LDEAQNNDKSKGQKVIADGQNGKYSYKNKQSFAKQSYSVSSKNGSKQKIDAKQSKTKHPSIFLRNKNTSEA
jgi:hypothetical protein